MHRDDHEQENKQVNVECLEGAINATSYCTHIK
jgi:hypothetical protein